MMIVELLTSLFDAVLYIWFIMRFAGVKKFDWLSATAIAVYFVCTVLCDWLLDGLFILGSVLLFLVALTFGLLIAKKHYVKAILACGMYKAVYILTSSAIFFVMSSLIDDFEPLLQNSGTGIRVVYLSMHKVLLLSAVILLLVIFGSSEFHDLLTGLVVVGISFLTIFGLGMTMVILLSDSAPEHPAVSYLLFAVFLLINVCVYLLVNHVKKLERQKYEWQLFLDRYEYQQEKYKEVMGIWNNTRKVRHDLNNHLIAIQSELDAGQIEKCRQYVASLISSAELIGKSVQTGNVVLDSLINSKLYSLQDTEVVVSGVIGDLSDIPDSDLVAVFGNLIDNAVEAVERSEKKRIELLFGNHGDNRVIICRNTVGNSVLIGNENLRSTKADKESHGLGHLIIEETVSKHGGMVEYSEADDQFSVQIVLPVHS